LQALQKNRAPAFGTGRCVAIDQLLNGLAESEVRTETMETLRQLASLQLLPEMWRQPACKDWFAGKTRFKPSRLWTSPCISTGPDVQKAVY
jgi:hypothetical protein